MIEPLRVSYIHFLTKIFFMIKWTYGFFILIWRHLLSLYRHSFLLFINYLLETHLNVNNKLLISLSIYNDNNKSVRNIFDLAQYSVQAKHLLILWHTIMDLFKHFKIKGISKHHLWLTLILTKKNWIIHLAVAVKVQLYQKGKKFEDNPDICLIILWYSANVCYMRESDYLLKTKTRIRLPQVSKDLFHAEIIECPPPP